VFRLPGLGFFAKLDDVLVEVPVVVVGLVELAGEVVDVAFEAVVAVPRVADEGLELEDVATGFVAEVQDVLFGYVEVLAQGGDRGGCFAGINGDGIWVHAGARDFVVGWKLGSVLGLLEVRLVLEGLGADLIFVLLCRVLILWRGCGRSAMGYGRRRCCRHLVTVVVWCRLVSELCRRLRRWREDAGELAGHLGVMKRRYNYLLE